LEPDDVLVVGLEFGDREGLLETVEEQERLELGVIRHYDQEGDDAVEDLVSVCVGLEVGLG
jgi:hypothetical protein